MLVEELTEEEVAVSVVIVSFYRKLGRLDSALSVDRLALGVLLRDKSGKGQFAELQLGLHTEQSRTASYQARPGSHAYVTGFNALDDFVLLALVCEFQVFRIEIESGVRIVGHVELHLIAH